MTIENLPDGPKKIPAAEAVKKAAGFLPYAPNVQAVGRNISLDIADVRVRLAALHTPEQFQSELQGLLFAAAAAVPVISLEGLSGSGKDYQELRLFQKLQPAAYANIASLLPAEPSPWYVTRLLQAHGPNAVRLAKMAGFIDWRGEHERYMQYYGMPFQLAYNREYFELGRLRDSANQAQKTKRDISPEQYLAEMYRENPGEMDRRWREFRANFDFEDDFYDDPDESAMEFFEQDQKHAHQAILDAVEIGERSWHFLQKILQYHLFDLQGQSGSCIIGNRGYITRLINYEKYAALRNFDHPLKTTFAHPELADLEAETAVRGWDPSIWQVSMPLPALTIYIDVDKEELVRRIENDSEKKREAASRKASVETNYDGVGSMARDFARHHPDRVAIIDGNQQRDAVTEQIITEIKNRNITLPR